MSNTDQTISDATTGHQLSCHYGKLETGSYFVYEKVLYRKVQNGWLHKNVPDHSILDVDSGVVLTDPFIIGAVEQNLLDMIKTVHLQYIRKEDLDEG